MAERHFSCTACGQCCTGWIPLTVADALHHAGRFPLALVWTPVRQGHKAFAATARIGPLVRLPNKRQVAIRAAPTAYLPPGFPCPERTADNLCGIEADKPLRCRTMPLFPYLDEADQIDQLVPRPGWRCDTSAQAPVIYRDKVVVQRDDFDAERRALHEQAPALRRYVESVLAASPGLLSSVVQAAAKPGGGHVVTSLIPFLPTLPDVDMLAFARRQLPVLTTMAERMAPNPEHKDYHAHYLEWARVLQRLITRREKT